MTDTIAQAAPPKPLLAFHASAELKDKYLARVRADRAAGELVPGIGWNGRKGCSVGCTFETYDHARGPIEIGVPTELMLVNDSIFEGLAGTCGREHLEFPEAFLSAIPVGADLSLVWPRLCLWTLMDKASPAAPWLSQVDPKTAHAVVAIAGLFEEWVASGQRPAAERWRTAALDARAARAGAWRAMRAQLLALLAEAPVPNVAA